MVEGAPSIVEVLPKFLDFVGDDVLVAHNAEFDVGFIRRACEEQGILSLAETAAFGDDLPDIRMLTMCGCGVAMGNALPEVKDAADIVIGGNDEEGIAEYLETVFCHIFPKLS